MLHTERENFNHYCSCNLHQLH
uniref:Uncharacterized protein n=1 Tax=Rhizophora mucronata TaxID=61149 RepID=A0A2P2Q1W0_RHIMU